MGLSKVNSQGRGARKGFKAYDKDYKESFEFKVAGKSNNVNLRLTGEMMTEIEILNTGNGWIEIGFEAGSEVNDKAAWNQVDHARPFLGVTENEINNILKNFIPDGASTPSEEVSLTQSFIRSLLGNS